MASVIHFISNDFNSSFVVAETACKRGWRDIEEFTSEDYIKDVTCKQCLNKLNL